MGVVCMQVYYYLPLGVYDPFKRIYVYISTEPAVVYAYGEAVESVKLSLCSLANKPL
jgi:hypothetical protein